MRGLRECAQCGRHLQLELLLLGIFVMLGCTCYLGQTDPPYVKK